MSKKNTGLFIALGAVLGAATAGISYYYLKYKSFNDDLNKDFHDYEDENGAVTEAEPKTVSCEKSEGRSYITLNGAKKEEGLSDAPETAKPDTSETEVGTEAKAETKTDAEAAETMDARKADAEAENAEPGAKGVTVEEDTDGADA